jgi:hypothetical protein
MAEFQIGDEEMQHFSIHPNGPVDGVPTWNVLSGAGTLRSDPAHADWDPLLAEGYQMFIVAPTLPASESGPVDTVVEVAADVDLGSGVQHLTETITMHVINTATSLGLEGKAPVPKP